MYTHHSVSSEVARDRQRDMMAAARRELRARQASPAPAAQGPAQDRSRRAWRLVPRLRPQAQS
jgi:hypothetical protein